MQGAATQSAPQHFIKAEAIAQAHPLVTEKRCVFNSRALARSSLDPGDFTAQKVQPFRTAAWRHRSAPGSLSSVFVLAKVSFSNRESRTIFATIFAPIFAMSLATIFRIVTKTWRISRGIVRREPVHIRELLVQI
jgi:hypothetical protein